MWTKLERGGGTNFDSGKSVKTSCQNISILFASQLSWTTLSPREIVFLKTLSSSIHGRFTTIIFRGVGRKMHRDTLKASTSIINSGGRMNRPEIPLTRGSRTNSWETSWIWCLLIYCCSTTWLMPPGSMFFQLWLFHLDIYSRWKHRTKIGGKCVPFGRKLRQNPVSFRTLTNFHGGESYYRRVGYVCVKVGHAPWSPERNSEYL